VTLYRKKTLVKATQFNKLGDHPAVVADPDSPTGFGILTLESTKRKFEVTLGDWIIEDSQGNAYACKDAIFREMYEEVKQTWIRKLFTMLKSIRSWIKS
jgi:hypothetical protein